MAESARQFFQRTATREPWHVTRYCRSWQWIADRVGGAHVLDAGGPSPFSRWLEKHACRVVQTGDRDLRCPMPDVPDDSFDVATCLEVLEHLKDPESSARHCFRGDGIRCCLAELFRVVRPGGCLFLTTPNVCCLYGAHRLLSGMHPYQYQPHERELSPRSIARFVTDAGWRIVRQELLQVWASRVPRRSQQALREFAKKWYSGKHRLDGDCCFLLAIKDS
jgi:SAM-dependent methyltransferase